MDGTILDTLDDLYDSITLTLKAFGLPPRTRDEVRSFLGHGLRALAEKSLPDGTAPEEAEKFYRAVSEHYLAHCADKTKPYDGITDLLKRLRKAGCLTAVVSNKADGAVRELVDRYFAGLFDAAVGQREGMRSKPAPDEVEAALSALGAEKKSAVYIGDSEVDLQTAVNSGLAVIMVDWGFRTRAQLSACGVTETVSSPAMIDALVL